MHNQHQHGQVNNVNIYLSSLSFCIELNNSGLSISSTLLDYESDQYIIEGIVNGKRLPAFVHLAVEGHSVVGDIQFSTLPLTP